VEGVCGKVSAQTAVNWHAGCSLAGDFKGGFGMAKAYCAPADVIVAVMGLSPKLEGEEGDASDTTAGGDRQRLELPGVQEEFLKELVAMGKPVVLVLMSGSAVAMPWAKENVPAIVQAWYPGEEGGTAVADVLFGDYNPAGRLPVTFYKGTFQLPEFRDYSMKGRTYRYFGGEPLYPFGYGLSYTSFRYSGLRVRVAKDGQSAKVAVTVRNTGERAGDEVVQLYLTDLEASAPVPIRSLRGFRRVNLKPGERKTVEFVLGAADLACVLEDGRAVVEPGEFEVSVGGGQPDTEAVAEARVVQARFRAG
jgi:beta-glucosidase